MANTTNNGATNGDRPGSDPLQNPGVTTGSNDSMAVAEAGFSQTHSALVPELVQKPLDSVARKQTLKLGKKRESLIGKWLGKAVKNPELAPGQDPQALLDEFNLVVRIQALVTGFHGLTKLGDDTVLVRLTSLWKSVMDIYGIAPHLRTSDPEVTALIAETLSVLSPGPRKQKTKKVAIAPIPQGKKAMKAALVAHAEAVQEPGVSPATVTPSQPATPAPAGTAPASGAPATNTNSGTPSSGKSS